MLEEKVTHTEPIYMGKVVRLNVHDVALPDGSTSRRELVDHPGAVAIVALDEQQNVLLIRQYRLGAGQVMVELPAGTLEPDEDVHEAAMRELREETGFRAATLEKVGGWFVTPGYTTEYIHLFVAQQLQEDPAQGDVDEFIERFRVPFTEAIDMVYKGEIFNTTAICGLLRAAHHLQG